MSNETNSGIVLTTVGSKTQANLVIEALLTKKLAACIQVLPIESHYVWEGKICNDEELLLVIKTTKVLYNAVEETICEKHEYDVPQIVQVSISDGFNPYLSWIEQVTAK
ncbi:divalent-cation tolerance protein CutA [Vibrio makurazakiensis]|uniref:divalent-cation tolerance protein CutA n=1 Tax=Vibrio makurazakiensis TaxID=2910250 RepID=UPI003D0B1DE6